MGLQEQKYFSLGENLAERLSFSFVFA